MCSKIVIAICLLAATAGAWHPNLVAWYRMEGNALDSSGQGLHGTLVNAPTVVPGRIGRGYEFDAALSQRVDVPLSLGANFTVAVWVRIDALVNSYFLNQTDGVSGGRMLIGEDGVDAWFFAGAFVGAKISPTLGRWYHMALTYDGTAYTSYLDGRFLGTHLNANAPPSVPVEIGGTSRIASRDSNGIIDEVMIFNAALSPSDIKRVMLGLMPLGRY